MPTRTLTLLPCIFHVRVALQWTITAIKSVFVCVNCERARFHLPVGEYLINRLTWFKLLQWQGFYQRRFTVKNPLLGLYCRLVYKVVRRRLELELSSLLKSIGRRTYIQTIRVENSNWGVLMMLGSCITPNHTPWGVLKCSVFFPQGSLCGGTFWSMRHAQWFIRCCGAICCRSDQEDRAISFFLREWPGFLLRE